MNSLTIGGATLNQIPLDWKGNFENIREAIVEARNRGVDVLNLPELCITGYGCEDMFLSDWVCSKASSILEQIVPLTEKICVIVGLPLQFNHKNFNASCVICDGEILGFYCKRHLAREGVHYEPRWFDSWEPNAVQKIDWNGRNYPIGDLTLELLGITVGFEICEDAWQEDRPAHKYIHQKADLILNPSASHFAFKKADYRERLVIESSRQYRCFYIYTNLLGNESGRMIFDGDIIIAGKGKLIQRNNRLSFENINLVSARIDFETGDCDAGPVNDWISDQNEEFTSAASLALFDYLRKSKSNGFALSLSGGADSSTCAVLVAEMVRRGCEQLGIQQFIERAGLTRLFKSQEGLTPKEIIGSILFTAYQGTKNSSQETFDSAKELADSIGATFYNWKIDDEVNSYTGKIENSLGEKLTWEKDDITLQNIQARARAPIIWMIANIKNVLLLTTSNRSEGDVGYTTMDGDTAGSLAPIAAIDKPFILQWLKWAETELGYTGLHKVNSLAPTAELRPADKSQTDEKDLMPYNLLLTIERLAIRDKKSPVEIFQLLDTKGDLDKEAIKASLQKFFRLWSRNQWKRERIAPSFHFDDFNVDPRSWMRFPILSSGFEEELQDLDKL